MRPNDSSSCATRSARHAHCSPLLIFTSMATFSISPNVSEGFDRLQQLLVDLRVGDEIRVSEAAHASGLSEHVCLAMLEGLQRAGLMAQADTDRFVRRQLDFV
jgi:hypothetical protein